jgi:molybdopterin-guanine dinucleotide biosynthesis protein A
MLHKAGIVLCGGLSQRMGRPKAWLPFGGETLLQRVVRRLGEAVDPVVVVAAADQGLPPLPTTVSVVRDEEKGRGPLQGLAAGLEALAHDFPAAMSAAFVSSCDVPFLRPAFVRRLFALLGDHDICVPHFGDHHHPLAAVYRLSVLPAVKGLLDENRLRPYFLFEKCATRVVEAAELADIDPELDSLRNLNTPEEYEAAVREWARFSERACPGMTRPLT